MQEFVNNTRFYMSCWTLFFLGFGVVTYVVDRTYCQGVYTALYNFFHMTPLAKPQGFVYGHRARYKFVIAFIASTVQSGYLFFFTSFHANPFVELVLWLVEIPAMVLGFAIGFWAFKPVWEKRERLFGAIDKLDAVVEEHAQHARDPKVLVQKSVAAPAPTSTSEVPPAAPTTPELSPQERIARYGQRK